MKKALIAIVLLLIPASTFAAWTAIENFDSYSNGSVDGLNGGCFWSGAWSVAAGAVNVVTAPVGGQGGKALKVTTDGDNARRSFSSISTGTYHLQFYTTSSTNAGSLAAFYGSGTGRFGVSLNNSGSPSRVDGTDIVSTATNVGSYSTSAWTTIDVKFGHVAGKFAISINGGAYSADLTANGSNTTIDEVRFLSQSNGADINIDDIGPSAGASCTSVTTSILGLVWGMFFF